MLGPNRNNSDLPRVDGNSDCPRELRHLGATVSVLCDIHTALCAVSKLHRHTVTVKVIVSTYEPRHLLFSERVQTSSG